MKQRHFKALTSLLLVVVMLASMLPSIPVTVTAAGETNTYVKVTSAPDDWSGEYLIVYEAGSVIFDGSRTTLDATSNNVQVEIIENKITIVDDYSFTIEKNGSNYTIKSKSGYYIGNTSSSSNALKANVSTKYDCQISLASDGSVDIISTNTYLRFNPSTNSGDRFRFYKSASYKSQKAIHLYKLVETAACDHVVGTAANCQSPAICSKCQQPFGDKDLNKHADVVTIGENKAANCTEAGRTAGSKCNACNTTIVAETTIPALGHNFVNGVCTNENCDAECSEHTGGNATCKDQAICDNCQMPYGELSATHGEAVVDAAVEPTCTETGLTEGSHCSICDAPIVAQEEVAAKGHNTDGSIDHADATCTEAGVVGGTYCSACEYGKAAAEATIPALGHNYVNGVCTRCNAKEPSGFYIAAIRTSGNYFYMTSDLGTASTKRYQAKDSGLTTLPTEINNPTTGYVFKLEDAGDGKYYIVAVGIEGNNYLGWTSGNSGILVANGSAIKFTKTENNDGTVCFSFAASDGTRYLALNGTSGNNYFAMYKDGQKQNLTLIPVVQGECQHTNTTTKTTPATCTAAGVEEVICSDCEITVSTTEIPALHHNYDYATGECQECDAIAPVSVGDQVYLTANNHSVLLTGFNTDKNYGTVGALSDAKAVEIEEGAVRGTHSFKYDGKYLAWANENTLVLVDEKNEMASWIIEFADGTFKIINSKSNDRVIKYNANDSRFSTYSNNTFPAVQIIKVPTAPTYVEHGFSLEGGVTINVTANVSAEWLALNPNAKVLFRGTYGTEVEFNAENVYKYTFTPKALGEKVTFVITDGNNDIVTHDVSYTAYKEAMDAYIEENPDSEQAKAADLLDKIDQYTAAANGTLEAGAVLKDDFFNGESNWQAATGEIFKGTYANLGEKINVRFKINTQIDYTDYKVTVVLGGVTLVDNDDFAKFITSAGELAVTGLAPTHLNDELTVTVYSEDVQVAESSFVLNDYLKAVYAEADQATKNLIVATYQYGVAAENYKANNQ